MVKTYGGVRRSDFGGGSTQAITYGVGSFVSRSFSQTCVLLFASLPMPATSNGGVAPFKALFRPATSRTPFATSVHFITRPLRVPNGEVQWHGRICHYPSTKTCHSTDVNRSRMGSSGKAAHESMPRQVHKWSGDIGYERVDCVRRQWKLYGPINDDIQQYVRDHPTGVASRPNPEKDVAGSDLQERNSRSRDNNRGTASPIITPISLSDRAVFVLPRHISHNEPQIMYQSGGSVPMPID